MCHFITIGVPSKHRHHVEALRMERDGFRVDRSSNASVARLFPPDHDLFTVTHGGCSCGLYAEPTSTTAEEEEAAIRSRYRRKGWSEAKISRALEATRRPRGAAEKDHRARFCQAVSAIVNVAGHVRLFAHMYSGRIETEDVGTAAQLTMPLQEFQRQGGAFNVDTVVELVRGTG